MGKLIRKHMKTMISTLKSLFLINFVKKSSQNHLTVGALPGVTLLLGTCQNAEKHLKDLKPVGRRKTTWTDRFGTTRVSRHQPLQKIQTKKSRRG